MAPTQALNAHAPAWLVCRGAVRVVIGGHVMCPLPDLIGWEACIGCRHLEDVEHDRDRGCGEPEPDSRVEMPGDPALHPGHLIVDLL